MSDELRPSNWRKEARAMEEAELRCPRCPAMNRPGALLVKLDDKGVAGCDQCGHVWTVDLSLRGRDAALEHKQLYFHGKVAVPSEEK